MIKAVAFDFGNTLMTSKFPPSWKEFYPDALTAILKHIGLEPVPEKIQSGQDILLKYNTRVNPREYEIDSSTIFLEMFNKWGIRNSGGIRSATDVFAAFFLSEPEPYPDATPTLRELKDKGLKVGVLTNTAYGLDKEYFMRDATEVIRYIDVFLSSTEVGFRKPNPEGFKILAERLGVSAGECIFVGDEEVDIKGANNCGMTSVLIDRNGNKNRFGEVHTVKSLTEVLSLI